MYGKSFYYDANGQHAELIHPDYRIYLYIYIYIRAQVMVEKNTHGNRIKKYMRYVTSRQNPFTGRHCYNVSMFAYCYTGNCA